jgi:hypothetical protein
MTNTQNTDHFASAKAQGQAQFDHIVELVEALSKAQGKDDDDATLTDYEGAAERAIHEDALSIEVRSDWIRANDWHTTPLKPFEYRILLCTGGPAVQLVGTLSEHGVPETAQLEVQDWFTSWIEFKPVYKNSHDASAESCLDDVKARDDILLTYAGCFWFGE